MGTDKGQGMDDPRAVVYFEKQAACEVDALVKGTQQHMAPFWAATARLNGCLNSMGADALVVILCSVVAHITYA